MQMSTNTSYELHTLNYTSYLEEENIQTLDFVTVHMNLSNGVNMSKSKYAQRLWRLHTDMIYNLICYTSRYAVWLLEKYLHPIFQLLKN